MAHDVFVSYSQHDKPVADAVVARLEQAGIRCWMAPRDVLAGTSWGDAIVDAIAASRVMVVVLSGSSNRSRQVIREVERAVASDVVILPFHVENVDPSGAMAYFLGTEHWLDALTPPIEAHIDRLVETVTLLLSGQSVPSERPFRPAGAGPPSRRRTWLPLALGGGLGLAAAAVLAIVLSGGGEAPATTTDGTSTSGGGATVLESTTTSVPAVAVALEEVGRYAPLDLDPDDLQPPGLVNGFDVDGSMLAFANGVDGVTRVAIGDPAQPRPTETFAVEDAQAVALAGDWVYALSGDMGPQEIVVFPVDGSGGGVLPEGPVAAASPYSLYVVEEAGGYLYLAGHNYVGIADVTDPRSPTVVFEWQPPGATGNPANVFVSQGIGYFSAGWDGLYIFDLADPASPRLLGHWPSPNWIIDLVVVDGIAYVALGSAVATVDVSDPAAPVTLGSVPSPGFAAHLDVAQGWAFVGYLGEDGALGGIGLVDATDPGSLRWLDGAGPFQMVTGVRVVDGHLFITEAAQGLVVFEITGLS